PDTLASLSMLSSRARGRSSQAAFGPVRAPAQSLRNMVPSAGPDQPGGEAWPDLELQGDVAPVAGFAPVLKLPA
ncbi:hypothetical protein, partial [Klebsiella pneumoniae]|uniref:hypothetical protein n=1 Tax=Klebsiella pneumoniae TaxID=573 RepID=UPI001952BCE5